MRNWVPKLATSVLLFLSVAGRAQLKQAITNNNLRNNVSIVISDYNTGFSTLKSDTTIITAQSIQFATKLDCQGCELNSITQYKSNSPTYSWEAVLLSSENFEQVSKKYHWLCTQLKMITLNMQGHSFTLSGDYNAADESKKFTSTIFRLMPKISDIDKLKIEPSIRFEFPEWKVGLVIYEREREDNEQGDINGN